MRWGRSALAAVAVLVLAAGLIVITTRDAEPEGLDLVDARLGDADRFGSGLEAGDTLAEVSGVLLVEARSCATPAPRCTGIQQAAALAQTLAVRVLDCTAPGRFEARQRLRLFVRAVDQLTAHDEVPPLPAPPAC